jgi:CopG family transcriptional regulator / antitoxin EndoAI
MAGKSTARSYERLNITLPRETVGLLDRVTTKGARSRFINDAIRERVASVGKGKLRRQLEEGYASRFARDLRMVEEWLAVDEQTWEHAERRRRVRK